MKPSYPENNNQEKKILGLSRRDFLKNTLKAAAGGAVVGAVIAQGPGIVLKNKEHIEDWLDEMRNLDPSLQLHVERIHSRVKELEVKYDLTIKVKGLREYMETQRTKVKSKSVLGTIVEGGKPEWKSEALEEYLNSLDIALSAWPKSMLRSIAKIRLEGFKDEYKNGGHVDVSRGFADNLDVYQGREIYLNWRTDPTIVFPHEMVHLSEKYFTGNERGLDKMWLEMIKLAGVESEYLKVHGADFTPEVAAKVTKEKMVKEGFVRSYSATEPCEDRATTLETIFNTFLENKFEAWELGLEERNSYEFKIWKKQQIMQALMYTFSLGEMGTNYFLTIKNRERSVEENHNATSQELKFNHSVKPKTYVEYQQICKTKFCEALNVQSLPSSIKAFLQSVFDSKLTEDDWNKYK